MPSPGASGPPLVGGAENNYGIPSLQGYPAPTGVGVLRNPQSAAPIPSAAVPPTLPKHLVQPFTGVMSLYSRQSVPNAPGGLQAAMLTAGMESSFGTDPRTNKVSAGGATGLMQFQFPTFKEMVAGEPWAKGLTEPELRQKMMDPRYQAFAEARYRQKNFDVLTSGKYRGLVKDPANPWNLYVMHHFGPGDGPKIVLALQNTPNITVDQALGKRYSAVKAANPYIADPRTGAPLTMGAIYAEWMRRAKELGMYGGVRA